MNKQQKQKAEHTFQFDEALPKLPLPSIAQSLQGLAESVRVLRPDNSVPPSLQRLLVLLRKEEGRQGQKEGEKQEEEEEDEEDVVAQRELHALRGAHNRVLSQRHALHDNYIGEWWDEAAYLRSRVPLVINTNVFCANDAEFNPTTLQAEPIVNDGLSRGALLILESLIFRHMLKHEELKPDRLMGTQPMCMHQYRRYYTIRLPRLHCDELYTNRPRDVDSVHVMYKGQCFFVRVVEKRQEKEKEKVLDYAQVRAALEYGCKKIDANNNKQHRINFSECVGLFTAADRDTWARAYTKLESLSPANKHILHRIKTSIFTLCLDDEPVHTLNQAIARASHLHAHNRWFDRSVIRMATPNGVALKNGDHSAMDAIVMASVPIELQNAWTKRFIAQGGMEKSVAAPSFRPQDHCHVARWVLDDDLRQQLLTIKQRHDTVSATKQVEVFTFRDFGRDQLRVAKLSPDALVQQAIQIAFYKDRKRVAPVYETASMRLFRNGRTEAIRALTREQLHLVKHYDSKPTTATATTTTVPKENVDKDAATWEREHCELLRLAMRRHAKLSQQCQSGQGFDRHLMALRIAHLQQQSQRPAATAAALPAFFTDPDVARAGTFELLTSQMIGRTFVGGFAHALPDGYGLCYYLRPKQILIVLSGNTEAGLTDVGRYSEHLRETLRELVGMVVRAQQQQQQQGGGAGGNERDVQKGKEYRAKL